jgi:ribosomal-protein-alanine N-acetyltransferase
VARSKPTLPGEDRLNLESTNKNRTVISGNTVFLRSPNVADGQELIALNCASTGLHRGLVTPPRDSTQFDSYLEFAGRKDCKSFLIFRKEDQAIVGAITLSQIFMRGFRSAYLGYYIGEPYANRGFMSEAIHLVLRYAFKTLKLHRVEANIQPKNVASIALVKRAGFSQEGYSRRYIKIAGRWRDHERWAILAEDWRRRSHR